MNGEGRKSTGYFDKNGKEIFTGDIIYARRTHIWKEKDLGICYPELTPEAMEKINTETLENIFVVMYDEEYKWCNGFYLYSYWGPHFLLSQIDECECFMVVSIKDVKVYERKMVLTHTIDHPEGILIPCVDRKDRD